jgi:cell division protein FtsQ
MDRRVRERRRSVSRQRGRRRGSLVCVFALVLAIVALFVWLRSSDVFAVRRVVATTTEHVTAEDISRVTSDARGASLLQLSTETIERNLMALPYVCSAEVHRRFPDTLDVRLVEYEPVARLQDRSGGVWLVAEDGRVLELGPVSAAPELPLVVAADKLSLLAGDRVPNAILDALPLVALLQSTEFAGSLPAIDRIAVSSVGDVAVRLTGGEELRLGSPTELKQKLTVVGDIITQYLRDGRQIRYVDASVADRVAVKAE